MPARELAERLLAARPSQAKNFLQAARSHIRAAVGRYLVFLDGDRVLPLRLAFEGARFRLALDRKAFKRGLLRTDEALPSYLPVSFPLERARFVDSAGKPIAFQVKVVSRQVDTFLGPSTVTTRYADLSDWFAAQKVYVKDHLLFTVLDWQEGLFQLEREPSGRRCQASLAERNRLLADLLYEQLESAPEERILQYIAVPTAYARLPDRSGYPPDHWMVVVERDERMATDGWSIHYSDSGFSPLELLAHEMSAGVREGPLRSVSREQGEEVYRFRAAMLYQPALWRTIEVQGKHTLADLDMTLREAFGHDMSDHMGGFWKLVARGVQGKPGAARRGSSRRYRRVDLGTVEPFGGGKEADTRIAELGLAVEDLVEYVYDFGDWTEHRLTLEAVEKPQAGVEYPREVARSSR